jgi:hypothetical protein
MSPKVELVEETKGRRKEIKNNNEIYHICVGTRHKETHFKVLNNREWGKG